MSDILCNRFLLKTDSPLIMAIVNVSNDSFSGDGLSDITKAIKYCEHQLSTGANILDIGAESTRPQAVAISEKDEWQKLKPILKEVLTWSIPISVDTYKSEVIKKSLDLGVDIINNIYGFQNDSSRKNIGSFDLLKNSQAAGVIMHIQGTPTTMQVKPTYQDVLAEVCEYFNTQKKMAHKLGIAENRLIFDPGFGFGKTLEHNINLFKNIPKMANDFSPILVGVSRKSMFGTIADVEVDKRLSASVTAAVMAIDKGAKIVRVHDTAETLSAIKTFQALN